MHDVAALVAEVQEQQRQARLERRRRITDDYRPRREINQRTLRNESGSVMAAVEYGEAFVLTRGGVAVAELTPVLRRRFVPADVAVAEFAVDGFPSGSATSAGWPSAPSAPPS